MTKWKNSSHTVNVLGIFFKIKGFRKEMNMLVGSLYGETEDIEP